MAQQGERGTHEMEGRLRQWRQAHPRATFDEIEDAVQQEVVRWQAYLVEELLQGAESEEAPPTCGACGRAMQRCGTRGRRVVSRMGPALPVERDYYVCPACGAGCFPPG